MKVQAILKMNIRGVIAALTEEEFDLMISIYKTKENFVEKYQEGAMLSGDIEYFSPSDYLKLITDMIEENKANWITEDMKE